MKLISFLLVPFVLFSISYEKRGVTHILTIEPEKHELVIGLAQDNGLGIEPTSSMAKRHNAIAAINGGFFQDEVGQYIGASAGSLKINDTYFSNGFKNRGCIGWSESLLPFIDRLKLNVTVNDHLITRFNGNRKASDVILFSWPFHRHTLTLAGGTEYAISNNRIQSISKAGNMKIPENGYVLSVGPDAQFPTFKEGDTLDIAFHPSDEKWSNATNILDGTPVLIQNGQPIENYDAEQVIETFITKKHPRSAVGITKSGTWVFVCVDGRSDEAEGKTLKELTQLMIDLDCVSALNLDGGGSTTLYYNGQVMNTPADINYKGRHIERGVANCLMVLPKK